MKNVAEKKPGVYPLPDGRTETVLDVHPLHIDISAILDQKIKLRIQELVKQGAEKEAKNG